MDLRMGAELRGVEAHQSPPAAVASAGEHDGVHGLVVEQLAVRPETLGVAARETQSALPGGEVGGEPNPISHLDEPAFPDGERGRIDGAREGGDAHEVARAKTRKDDHVAQDKAPAIASQLSEAVAHRFHASAGRLHQERVGALGVEPGARRASGPDLGRARPGEPGGPARA
jgi:hypothetical protein